MSRPTIWTRDVVYAAIKTFVLAEHRLPVPYDFQREAHGLPVSSAAVYRVCKDYKTLLDHDGVSYRAVPTPNARHPWRRAAAALVAAKQARLIPDGAVTLGKE